MSLTAAIVEDDYLIAMSLTDLCEEIGISVIGNAYTDEEAISLLSEITPDFLLLDVRLGCEKDGVDIAMQLRASGHKSCIIFVTGSTEEETRQRMLGADPHGILPKPIQKQKLAEMTTLARSNLAS